MRNLLCKHCNFRLSPHFLNFPCFPCGPSGKESACQYRKPKKHGLDPWIKKILQSRKWQPTPVFLPGKYHGQRSLHSAAHARGLGKKNLDFAGHTQSLLHTLLQLFACFFWFSLKSFKNVELIPRLQAIQKQVGQIESQFTDPWSRGCAS